MEYKQAILIRSDLKMGCGKQCAQSAHASVEASLKAKKLHPFIFMKWQSEGMRKIVLKVSSKAELFKYKQKAEDYNLVTAAICDAGHTQVKAGTYTALAIGPDATENIDNIVKELQLL